MGNFCNIAHCLWPYFPAKAKRISEWVSIVLVKLFVLGGGVGIFIFSDLANFWFSFAIFALKNCSFSVLVSCAVCGFSPI